MLPWIDTKDFICKGLADGFNPPEIQKYLSESVKASQQPSGLRPRHQVFVTVFDQGHRDDGARKAIVISFPHVAVENILQSAI
jgi:hypothetical protein